jgi:hypothetical protein
MVMSGHAVGTSSMSGSAADPSLLLGDGEVYLARMGGAHLGIPLAHVVASLFPPS